MRPWMMTPTRSSPSKALWSTRRKEGRKEGRKGARLRRCALCFAERKCPSVLCLQATHRAVEGVCGCPLVTDAPKCSSRDLAVSALEQAAAAAGGCGCGAEEETRRPRGWWFRTEAERLSGSHTDQRLELLLRTVVAGAVHTSVQHTRARVPVSRRLETNRRSEQQLGCARGGG